MSNINKPTIRVNKKIMKELGYSLEGHLGIPKEITYRGVTYIVEGISKNGFRFCNRLKKVTIPPTITEIEENAFAWCWRLETVNFLNSPDSQLKSIKRNAFGHCHLVGVTLPPYVEVLQAFAFSDNYYLVHIELPDSLKTIGNYAFSNCANLETIVIPDSVTSMGEFIFDGCEGLTTAKLSANVPYLKNGIFVDCWDLREVFIPEGVKSMKMEAFNGCENIQHINLPSTMKKINSDHWIWNNKFKHFTFNGSKSEWLDTWEIYNSSKMPLRFPVKCLDGIVKDYY